MNTAQIIADQMWRDPETRKKFEEHTGLKETRENLDKYRTEFLSWAYKMIATEDQRILALELAVESGANSNQLVHFADQYIHYILTGEMPVQKEDKKKK